MSGTLAEMPRLAVTCPSLAWDFPASGPQTYTQEIKSLPSKLVKDQDRASVTATCSLPWEELGPATQKLLTRSTSMGSGIPGYGVRRIGLVLSCFWG